MDIQWISGGYSLDDHGEEVVGKGQKLFNHGFAKPWFRPWFPKFLKFPVPLIFCRNFPEFSHFRHLKGWERGGGVIRIQKGARLLVVNMSDLKGCGQYKGMRNVRTG